MAERGQVLHCLANSLSIIHLEHPDIGQVRSGIYKHQRKLALHQLPHQFLFDAEGHYGHAVHVTLQHAANQRLGAGRFVVGGTDQNFVALGNGKVFKLLNQLWKKWVGDLRNNEAQHAAAAGNQRPSLGVGQVAQLIDRPPDSPR